MNDLDELLARAPSTATWSALAAWFDAGLSVGAPRSAAVPRVRARLAAWPTTIARPLPYHWIFRLCDAASFPPASLADALCLGDRWVLHPDVSIARFENLSEQRLARLAATHDLPALRWLDVSCQTDGHPHSPGTMLYHAESVPDLLAAPTFAGLVGLDLSFSGVDLDGVAHILETHPALRVLALGAGDGDEVGEDLESLLALPGLARLEHLELHRIGARVDETRALLGCSQLAGLRSLAWPLDRASLIADGLAPDEFARLLAASPLAPTVKQWLREQYAEPFGSVIENGCFAELFPGEPGAPPGPEDS